MDNPGTYHVLFLFTSHRVWSLKAILSCGVVLSSATLNMIYFGLARNRSWSMGATYSADSVRDISVGNWQLRALEQELAAPVTQVLDQIIHEANVGWVPGRLIGTPILRVNRGVHRAQVAGEPYAVLLLDFMKAFPSVLLESMWQVLEAQGWDPAYIRAFRIMHTDMRQYSKIGGHFCISGSF
jgi:hypothetical protein